MQNNGEGGSKDSVITYRDAILQTTREVMAKKPNVVILGQGVGDHRGIFGTTLGLKEEFGEGRVIESPLAEEGMTGVAIGAALNGLYPIMTHIRADFSVLAMNQVINLAAKYRYMFGGQFTVPMLVRMVVGRSWGQGAQHSQSLQSLYAHIPGLRVIMPASAQSIMDGYRFAVSSYPSPVISIEHRLLYDLTFRVGGPARGRAVSAFGSRKVRRGKDITIVATSIMVLEALRAARHMAEVSDIDCEVIDLNCVSHIDAEQVIRSVKKTGRLIVADTSWPGYGVCAEVCRVVSTSVPSALKRPAVTLGLQPSPCPPAKALEAHYYPNIATFAQAIARLVTGKEKHGIPMPPPESTVEIYRNFKGPF